MKTESGHLGKDGCLEACACHTHRTEGLQFLEGVEPSWLSVHACSRLRQRMMQALLAAVLPSATLLLGHQECVLFQYHEQLLQLIAAGRCGSRKLTSQCNPCQPITARY